MNNSNYFGESESGYGYNENGAPMDRNDYLASNPDTNSGAYEENIRQAEKEEEDEIRSMYPGEYSHESQAEAVHALLENVRAVLARVEEMINQIVADDKEYRDRERTQRIGQIGTAPTTEKNAANLSSDTGRATYINTRGEVYPTPDGGARE